MRILAKSLGALSFMILLCSQTTLIAQTIYPQGVYTSLHDLQWKTPSLDTKAMAELRYGSSVYMFGGNDYNVYSNGILKREIRKEWRAYSDGNNLYVNCYPIGLQSHYAKVLTEGEYLFFNAAINERTVSSIILPVAVLTGLVGGVITHWIIAGRRRSYVLDLSTGRTTLLKPKSMHYLLEDDLDLQTEYEAEENQRGQVLLREYIAKLNDHIAERKRLEKAKLNIADSIFTKPVDLILYREKQKQKDQSMYLVIADSIHRELSVNSYSRVNLVYSGKPIKVCAIDSTNCVYVDFSEATIGYLSCSMTDKNPLVKLEVEDEYVGETLFKAVLRAQRKREKKAAKESD